MNIAVDEAPQVTSVTSQAKENKAVVSEPGQKSQPISFRRCAERTGKRLGTRTRKFKCSWNGVLSKIQQQAPAPDNVPQLVANTEPAATAVPTEPVQTQTHDRREFPRHSSEAVVLAFSKDGECDSAVGSHPGAKGYAINVSQNGLSFASRSVYTVREQLQLHVEDQRLNFALDVAASVVRVTPLDNEFWRVDCKLVSPLTDQQVALLKEHVPSCYAG